MIDQTIVQALILLLSGAAIWMVGSQSKHTRLWGCILGLAGQPFWAYSAWRGEQWGILILTAWYTLAWARGARNHWRKA